MITAPTNLELIQTLAEHASLEVLLTNLSQRLFDNAFALRICNTNVPIIGLLMNATELDKAIENYAFKKNAVAVSCLFYKLNDTKNKDFSIKFDIINVLLRVFQRGADEISEQDKQNLIKQFVNQAKQAQTQPEKQTNAMVLIHAGLFLWTRIQCPSVDDYKLVLQLLYLRGMVCRKLYRNNADELALITFKVAINLVLNLEYAISKELQQLRFYEMLGTAADSCKERLIERHKAGLFQKTAQQDIIVAKRSESSTLSTKL